MGLPLLVKQQEHHHVVRGHTELMSPLPALPKAGLEVCRVSRTARCQGAS